MGVQIPTREVAILRAQRAGPRTCPGVKVTRQGAEPVHCGCRLGRTRWGANTTEPSVCGGDAALRQITLTTCYDDVAIAERRTRLKAVVPCQNKIIVKNFSVLF